MFDFTIPFFPPFSVDRLEVCKDFFSLSGVFPFHLVEQQSYPVDWCNDNPVRTGSMTEIDSLKAEVLRQKIIFDSELRRQREVYEARISSIEQMLVDRELDCKNLQSVITILGRKLDALQDHVMSSQQQGLRRSSDGLGTPRRSSPSRRESNEGHVSAGRTSPFRSGGSVTPVPTARHESIGGGGGSQAFTATRASSITTAPQASVSRASSPDKGSVTGSVRGSAVSARPRVSNGTTIRATTPRLSRF